MLFAWKQDYGEHMNTATLDVSASNKIELENHKLEKRLCRQVGDAIVTYNMIEQGDHVMVCMSGRPFWGTWARS